MPVTKTPFRLFAPRHERAAAMPFIMLTVLIDMISIGIMIPVLPALVGTFTASQADQAFWLGVVGFTFSTANFISSPVLGALSDAHGRRPLLLLGFSGLALSFFVTALTTSMVLLIGIRLFSGAMQSNIAVANAYVADITPPTERARRFGMLGAMFGIGFILGPVVGGLLGAIDLRLPFFAAGSMALVNLAYGYFVLPESLPPERRHKINWRACNPVSSLRGLTQLKGVGVLVAVVACAGLAQFMLQSCWVLYTTFKFGWGPLQNGLSLAAVGVSSAIVQGLLLGRLLKRFSPRRLAVMGLSSSAVAFALFGAATQGWMLYVIIFGNLLGATVSAAIQSIISSAADERSQGKVMGAVSGINSLMAVTAPPIGASLLITIAHLPRGDWRIGMPFYFCALLQSMALALAVWHFRRERHRAA
jgi:DHA1 family tetracycline resistance protein-like MFS transporter